MSSGTTLTGDVLAQLGKRHKSMDRIEEWVEANLLLGVSQNNPLYHISKPAQPFFFYSYKPNKSQKAA
jgi:hypothetical protein